MRRLNRWLRELGVRQYSEPLEGEIDPVYTKDDVRNAHKGHVPFAGTDVEIVAYREGDDLVLLVNKSACVFRTRLVGTFRTDLDVSEANMFTHDDRTVLCESPKNMDEFVKRPLR